MSSFINRLSTDLQSMLFRLVVHYSQAISKSQIRLLLDKAVGKILFPSMMHLSLIGHIVSFS